MSRMKGRETAVFLMTEGVILETARYFFRFRY